MRALPIQNKLQAYAGCCGKTICSGCDFQHQIKSAEQAAERGQKPGPSTCAFCRTPVPKSDEDVLAQLRKRVELKDRLALRNMALNHGLGDLGLPVDQAKCIELLHRSAALGFPAAQYQLGNFYRDGMMGLRRNEKEELKYHKEAAEGGHLVARHNLACAEVKNGNHIAAMRHSRLSASGGYWRSMGALIGCFQEGFLQHEDLAKTLRAFYRARAEMKSDDRDEYIKHLKRTGEYDEEYD
jgi:TPR repeat protein